MSPKPSAAAKGLQAVTPTYLSDEEVDARLRAIDNALFSGSLVDMVARQEVVQRMVSELIAARGAGAIPEDIWDAQVALDELVQGKIDRVADRIKTEIPAYIHALNESTQAQIARAERLQERLEDLVFEAVELAKADNPRRTMINGMRWRARVQINGRPSVSVLDEAKVPPQYRRKEISISFKVPVTDEAGLAYWSQVMAAFDGCKAFNGRMVETIDTEQIYQDWKAPRPELEEGKAPVPFGVAGVEVLLGSHVRIEATKDIAKAIPEPIKIPKPAVKA